MKKVFWLVVLSGLFWVGYYSYGIINAAPNSSDTLQMEKNTAMVNTSQTEKALEGTEIGDTAPDFELVSTNEEKVKLSDYRGKKVMLNFWATWCPPCREEIPAMQNFYDEKEIVILAVNLTQTEAKKQDVENFMEKHRVTFPVLLDEASDVSNKYRIQPIPTTYMIDSQGKIRFKAYGAMTYEQMVSEFEKMK
ncbi:peroxiredoxin family protein [Virgibacillus halodenitrificans]|uniref:Redoxin domain-containing protein n=1 Tax=Virgibacillus halodenitrificans TaxID=1482 RepID=A0ABR7VRV3_VIRHA|nr:redoxin domain-containing protein [Virgibacillus halodenitrificans]MBD1223653.1 redoxin domain-containing protein [Virgibacillus halodenitrificans]CDQ36747.1 Thiol-disulfide oxidoreductase ResA [Virgibacillus halodenitrificans]